MNKEKEKMKEVLEYLCDSVDTIINKEMFQEKEEKQKLYAISSFLEFLKAGASVKVLPIKAEEATFIINMK